MISNLLPYDDVEEGGPDEKANATVSERTKDTIEVDQRTWMMQLPLKQIERLNYVKRKHEILSRYSVKEHKHNLTSTTGDAIIYLFIYLFEIMYTTESENQPGRSLIF